MKIFLVILFSTSVACKVSAQLAISPGAQVTLSGVVQLTLNNTSFINNGSFAAGSSVISFTGNGPNSVNGTQPVQFHAVEMNKTGNGFVLLLHPVAISENLLFIAGFLNLNGFNADLGTTGIIQNESDSARVIGANGGEVLATANLNAPVQANPGSLGLFITSTQDLGNVTIHRGHKLQTNNPGGPAGIQRYYELIPANNAALNATLAFKYLDAELNNLAENSLSLFESDDGINWKNQGFETRNTGADFIEKNSIGTLGRFTLFSTLTPLPVHFVSVSARCQNYSVVVVWKTAQEHNIHHYSIERSEDGNSWTTIGKQAAIGNGAAETTYIFTDNHPVQTAYNRIAAYDIDGTVHYSTTVHTSCAAPDMFEMYPNPVIDKLVISIVAANNSTALIQLLDNKGALVKQQTDPIFRGPNRLMIDMSTLAQGIYHLSVEWNNGQAKKTVQVLKY